MKSTSWRHYVAVAMLILALASLAVLLLRPGLNPYLSVDELLARGSELRGRHVRLAGYVMGSVSHTVSGVATFRVEARGSSLPVVCTDVVPPTLSNGDAVLLDGELGEDAVFRAHRLLTQCAARYKERLGDRPVGR